MNFKPNSYSKNVFINCPFDNAYFELLNAILFTVVYFGFNPRLALESSDSGESRLKKIVTLIRESQFSIHDISRLQAKAKGEYYRLNMPFELGVDYGIRISTKLYSDKRSLVLETEQYEYMKALSDINGFDIKNHNDYSDALIKCLRSWFSETVGLRGLSSSNKIFADFLDFNKQLFLKKVAKYSQSHSLSDAEAFAKTEIQDLTVPEYIDEVKEWKRINQKG